MEKKEIRIKCTGCQASYKLRVPATDKPVLFKCPKCGKSLKLMVKSVPARPATAPAPATTTAERPPGFESHRLSDIEDGQDAVSPGPDLKVPSIIDHLFGTETPGQQVSAPGKTGMWIFLAADKIKGPFTNEQIRSMIRKGEITHETPLRRGERPWVAAGKVPDFGHVFREEAKPSPRAGLDSMKLLEPEQARAVAGKRLHEDLSGIVPYPIRGGNWQPLAIFLGIAFVLSAALCMDFILGLPINLLGWLVLYGYLFTLMIQSMESPGNPPPAWNFAAAREMVTEGAKVLAVLIVFSLLPVAILLTLATAFYLNDMQWLGLLFLGLTLTAFTASLFVVPASLVVLAGTGRLGWALNSSRVIRILKEGGRPYFVLAVCSVAAGLACMVAAMLSVFLVDIPVAGFLVSGFLMALVFSYGHFIWFHVVGRFAGENRRLPGPVVKEARA